MAAVEKSLLYSKNPWWVGAEIIKQDVRLRELALQKYKLPLNVSDRMDLSKDAIYTIRGPRQIGKSTLIKRIIEDLLLQKKVPPKNVFFFSCDMVEDYKELYSILDEYLSSWGANDLRKYILLDEISFVDQWPRAIKDLKDSGELENTTCIFTGSNIIDIQNSGELLPGRRGAVPKWDFPILPIGFDVFVSVVAPELGIIDSEETAIHHIKKLNRLFDVYLLTGGFPRSINEYYQNGFIPSYVYELYLNWIYGDIHKLNKSDRVFNNIMEQILRTRGTPVSWNNLAKQAGVVSNATALEYVEILERMFVLFRAEFIDVSYKRANLKKNKKLYFLDPFICHALSAHILGIDDEPFSYSEKMLLDSSAKAGLVENVVGIDLFRRCNRIYYWQSKKEVDFVVRDGSKLSFYEVKHQTKVREAEFGWFEKIFPDQKITVITANDFFEGKNMKLVPIVAFLAGKQ